MQRSPARLQVYPRLLAALVALQFAGLAWLWAHGFPRYTADGLCFKQPAVMWLHTGRFSIPTYTGACPASDKFNSYPAVVYYYLNALVFRVFGCDLFVSLTIDLAIHFGVSVLGSWCLWRVTGRQLPAAVFMLASSLALLPIGRPEELGILLAMLALAVVDRGTAGWLAAVGLLGLTGVTSPGAALVGTSLVATYYGCRHSFQRASWPRLAALLFVPPLIAVSIYVWYTWPDLSEAIAQHRVLRDTEIYYTERLPDTVRRNPAWAFSALPLVFVGLGMGVYCVVRRPSWYPPATPAGAFVAAATLALAVGCFVNLIVRRVEYDFRHVELLSLALLVIVASWWPLSANGRYAPRALAGWGLVLALSLPLQSMLARFTLAPLTWEPDAISFADAERLVAETVPPDATVGGDGAVWSLIVDGRPFIGTQSASINNWPDYMISGTWSRTPALAQQDPFVHKLAEEYEELPQSASLPDDGSNLNVLGWRVPLATGRCDWGVRIWKRRADAPRPQTAAP